MRRPVTLMPRLGAILATWLLALTAQAQPRDRLHDVASSPVTDAMLREPDAADWLMYSRTYDAQRFSPLDEINSRNVGLLQRA